MKRLAIAAAVLALFSVSIAVAQRHEQAANAEVSGIFSALAAGDWVEVKSAAPNGFALPDHFVLTIQEGRPEVIRDAMAEWDNYQRGVREAGEENVKEFERLLLKFGIPFTKFDALFEVRQVSNEHVTISNSQRTLHIPRASVRYIAGPASKVSGEAD